MQRHAIHGLVARQAPSRNAGAVIQRTRIAAGYDRMSSGGKGDVLVTSGLMNCIAIVAQDKDSKAAVMAHYNTGLAYVVSSKTFSVDKLTAVRSTLLKELKKAVSDPDVEYFLGMGAVWFNMTYNDNPKSTDSILWDQRFALLVALKKVFNTEPTKCGSTIEFDVSTSQMNGNKTSSTPIELPDEWSSAGLEL